MDLTLPRIEPARPVRSAADEIDRAGAQFKGAADAVANVLAETDKARIAVESQEATLQVSKGLHDTLQTIQTKPYVSPDEVESLFGGKVPDNVDLTEPVPGQPDPKVRQRRKVVPMHEVAPALFEQRAQAAVTDAARNVTDEPWRRNFERAAAVDVERKRVEMMDWQKGQFLADMEIRSVAQFRQAVAARNWPGAEAILNNAAFTMDVKTREGLRAELPSLRTEAEFSDRLRLVQTPEEADELISDINGNALGDGTEKYAKLGHKEQIQYGSMAQSRKREIVNDRIAAETRAKEMYYQEQANLVEEALRLANESGLSPSAFFSISKLDGKRLDFDKFQTLQKALEADPKRQTDWGRYTDIAKMPPEQLARLDVIRDLPRLAEPEYKQVIGWIREARTSGRSPVTAQEDDWIGAYVQGYLKIDPKTHQHEFNTAKARVIDTLIKFRATSPNEPITYNTIVTIASPNFVGAKTARGGAAAVLSEGISRATGRPVRNERLAAEERQMEAEKEIVIEAYRRYYDDEPSPEFRAEIRATLMNEADMRPVKARLQARGLDPNNLRFQVAEIVRTRVPPETAAHAQQYDADLRATREREAVVARSEARRAEEEAKRVAAEDAERERYRTLPFWKQRAELMEKDEVRHRVSWALEEERRKVQYAPLDNRPFRVGPPVAGSSSDPRVTVAMEKRRPVIEREVKELFDGYRAEYEELLKRRDGGDAVAAEILNRTSESFIRWVQAKQNGEVP